MQGRLGFFDFNSSMVRLKEEVQAAVSAVYKFQFLYGAIKSKLA